MHREKKNKDERGGKKEGERKQKRKRLLIDKVQIGISRSLVCVCVFVVGNSNAAEQRTNSSDVKVKGHGALTTLPTGSRLNVNIAKVKGQACCDLCC